MIGKEFTTNDCMDAGGRATQEQLPRHEGHEDMEFDDLSR